MPVEKRSSNFKKNRFLFNFYSRTWWLQKVFRLGTVGKSDYQLELLGDEWGNKESVGQVLDDFIKPFITQQSIVGEIGVGGGRIASKLVGSVKKFYCFDISQEMLKRARKLLSEYSHVEFVLLKAPEFDAELEGSFDFIYSFDVFVHLDLHLIWKYMKEIKKLLKKDGHAFLHTANLKAPDGWKKFSKQDQFSIQGHYFLCPEIIEIFAKQAGLKIVKQSIPCGNNFYYNRDYLFVLKKSC